MSFRDRLQEILDEHSDVVFTDPDLKASKLNDENAKQAIIDLIIQTLPAEASPLKPGVDDNANWLIEGYNGFRQALLERLGK